ncbi:NAD-binding protein [Patescibacteria group bacterium]|nr:NAD-binding protein [Patescibacteria group bacterium]
MKIIIVGGNATGLTLANLLGEEHDITIIEQDEEVAKKTANEISALVIHGDGTDMSILNEAGLKETDAIITTTDDKTNLMICEIAKSEKIEKIISLVSDPQNEELFTKLGITRLVSVVGTNVTAIKRQLSRVGDERIIAQLGEGKVQIVELNVSAKSKIVGKTPELNGARIAAIYRSGEMIIPSEDTLVEESDVVLVVVKTEDLPLIIDIIQGK